MGLAPPPTRRHELAEFLRHRREATTPDAVGLAADGNRRTPGLRREEVSQLAGVGLSWYTWLEQGREITPSPSVLDALARVYDLDPAERAHLFHLAGVALPLSGGAYPVDAPAELRDLVLGLEPNPAYLIGPRSDVLVWNGAAAQVLGEPSLAPDGTPNLLWWMFTEPGPHGLGWSAQIGTKSIAHPKLGRLAFHHLQSIPTTHPDLRLTQFVPADDATRSALDRPG